MVYMNSTAADIDERERAESLRLAERGTLEMIAARARLADILAHIGRAIDAQDPDMMSTILLTDPDGGCRRGAVSHRL